VRFKLANTRLRKNRTELITQTRTFYHIITNYLGGQRTKKEKKKNKITTEKKKRNEQGRKTRKTGRK
jgi:hypothetical protein